MALFDLTPSGLMLPTGLGGPGRAAVPAAMPPGAVRIAPVTTSRTEGPLISYQEVYEQSAAVGAVVNKIAHNAVRVPVALYRRPAKRDGRRERVHDHRVLDLLEKPQPGSGDVDLKQWLLKPPLMHGNGLLGKYRADGPGTLPTELFPLDWRYLSALAYPGGRVVMWITTEGAQVHHLKPSEVVHVAWYGGSGAIGQIGVSPLQQLAASIAVDDAAQRHNYSQLAEAARPGGVFKLPPDAKATPEVIAELRGTLDYWSGVDKAGGTPILLGGAEWVIPGQQTAEEAQVLGVRRQSREDVCMVYDTSPTVIGLLENATQRGNVAELNKDFFGNTMPPWFALIAGAINRQLIDPEPEWRDERLFVAFDPSEFLRGDALQWAQAQEIRVRSGGLTLDERRIEDGEPPFEVPGSDEPILSDNNLHPLSQIFSGAATTAAQRATAAARRLTGRARGGTSAE